MPTPAWTIRPALTWPPSYARTCRVPPPAGSASGHETFAEVFAVASAERLAELDAHDDDAAIVTVVDEVIDAQVSRAPPSTLAVVLAWAGGIMHARQAERAVKVLGEDTARR